MRILLFGGSGLLGRTLKTLCPDMVTPAHEEVDVRVLEFVERCVAAQAPDVLIHAAALTDNRVVERAPMEAIQTNIVGTANVALACIRHQVRLVYISTDYIYEGDRGNYRETDEILPFNPYAWTKLGGEASARLVPNHLIVRTSFGPSRFPYPRAFVDKWVSKDYVDVLAPLLLDAAISPLTGVLNLGSQRRTVYEFASERNASVQAVRIGEAAFNTPSDTSLNLDKWMRYKSDRPVAWVRTVCRICGGSDLRKYLDLGLMPLANNLALAAREARAQERFPLQVVFCGSCGQSQLSVVVDPGVMYSYYTYRSSISKAYGDHCRELAAAIRERLDVRPSDLAIDIAGNDGTLLRAFREVLPIRPLNVDPAGNIAAISRERGIPVVNDFWSEPLARRLLAEHGPARIITATNVLAHVDNVSAFLAAVKVSLAPDGLFFVEFPYLVDFIQHREFDTVYFEHLSYFLVNPLQGLIAAAGLQLRRVSHHAIHGGTLRLEIGHAGGRADVSVEQAMELERAQGFLDFSTYHVWAGRVRDLVQDIRTGLVELKRKGASIAAFAASAKGNTLLNACGMTTDIVDYIVDDTPEKIGKFSPGNGIPIVNRSVLESEPPDHLLILAWNFKDEIIASLPNFKGRYIIPNPSFTILDAAGGNLSQLPSKSPEPERSNPIPAP